MVAKAPEPLEETVNISFKTGGKKVSFRGRYLAAVTTAWDPEKQEEREEHDIYELYIDEDNRYRILQRRVHGKQKTVQSHTVCEDWQSLKRRVENTPASRLLDLGLKSLG